MQKELNQYLSPTSVSREKTVIFWKMPKVKSPKMPIFRQLFENGAVKSAQILIS